MNATKTTSAETQADLDALTRELSKLALALRRCGCRNRRCEHYKSWAEKAKERNAMDLRIKRAKWMATHGYVPSYLPAEPL